MAKWYPSSTSGDIRGKLGDNVYAFQKGVHYIRRHNANPNQPNSASQQARRQDLANLSASWFSLSQTYKDMWWKAASLRGGGNQGIAEFLRANLFIYACGIAGLPRIDHPPLSIATPPHPESFQVTATDSTQNVIAWSAPDAADVYIQAWRQFDWNYYSGYTQNWIMLSSDTSSSLQLIDNHDTPSGARIWYKIRSFDAQARRSPFTHVIKITVPD